MPDYLLTAMETEELLSMAASLAKQGKSIAAQALREIAESVGTPARCRAMPPVNLGGLSCGRPEGHFGNHCKTFTQGDLIVQWHD